CFNEGQLGGDAQTDYLSFLNGGAGGTRQWDVGLSKGIVQDSWDQGFSIHHAVIDVVYAARLAVAAGLPRISIQGMTNIGFAFAYLLKKFPGQTLGTHAIVREMIRKQSAGLDQFMIEHGAFGGDSSQVIADCVATLPEQIQVSALINVGVADFESATH
ncbi:MAG: hypothetical protein OQL27_07700, partial [Sedimenticola sp.]|nr:hypothetical protein [Sedimenticola sp.]